MYYLEDNHPSYEYTLYVQVGSATPYIGVWKATEISDVYRMIGEIEKRHNRYRQHFYIDNDFYKNHYNKNDYVWYYRFMKRKVNDWQTVKTQRKEQKTKNKILQFRYNG